MDELVSVEPERRREERRTNPTLAELTLPELRRMLVTTMMLVIVLVLFLWMVRTVIIAAILGVIVASFTRPIYLWLYGKIPSQIVAAALTLMLLIVPVRRTDRLQLRRGYRRRGVHRHTQRRDRDAHRFVASQVSIPATGEHAGRRSPLRHRGVELRHEHPRARCARRWRAWRSRRRSSCSPSTTCSPTPTGFSNTSGAGFRRATASCRRRWSRTYAACCTARSTRRSSRRR